MVIGVRQRGSSPVVLLRGNAPLTVQIAPLPRAETLPLGAF
jgi:hypothetical protein